MANDPRPDFSGLWRMKLEASRLFGPPVATLAMRIQHREPDLIQEVKTAYADGRTAVTTFIGRNDGAEFTNQVGGATTRSRALWRGDELLVESTIETGERRILVRDCWSLSEDGATLRMEHRDGQLAGQCVVLERVDVLPLGAIRR